MPRQQQVQLREGVAQALAQAGDGGALAHQPAREPFSARLAAAVAAGGGGGVALPAAANLGGAALAPLREYAAFSLHGGAALEPVAEVAESPYARSPAPYGGTPVSGGPPSSAASTVMPGSPLTPASAYAAGASPLSGVSRLATPFSAGGGQRQSPGGLSAAATPCAGGLAGLSPLAAALSQAATPPASLGSALRSPLSAAGTPQPSWGLSDGGAFDASPAGMERLAHLPTPPAALQRLYEVRQFRWGCRSERGPAWQRLPGSCHPHHAVLVTGPDTRLHIAPAIAAATAPTT
jgi:hypothetical protein